MLCSMHINIIYNVYIKIIGTVSQVYVIFLLVADVQKYCITGTVCI